MELDIPIQVRELIFVIIWFIIMVFFTLLAVKSHKLNKDAKKLVEYTKGGRLGTALTEYGQVVFPDEALVHTVTELPKILSGMSNSAFVAALLSLLATILGICQLLLF